MDKGANKLTRIKALRGCGKSTMVFVNAINSMPIGKDIKEAFIRNLITNLYPNINKEKSN